MKTPIAIVMMLALLTASGCQTTSTAGGVAPINETFSITVPSSNTVTQGSNTAMTISLNRGAYFKRDVQLDVKTEGISVTPTSVLVKASDKPDVAFMISVAKDAALGEYRVTVTGTPATGAPTSTMFTVKVVAP